MASLWAVIVLPTPSHFSFPHFHCACLSSSSLRVSLLSRDRTFTAFVLAYTATVKRLTVSRVGFLVFVPCDCSRSRVVSSLITVLVFVRWRPMARRTAPRGLPGAERPGILMVAYSTSDPSAVLGSVGGAMERHRKISIKVTRETDTHTGVSLTR